MLTASSTDIKAAAIPDSAASNDVSSGAGAIETPAETPEKRAPTVGPTPTQNPATVSAETTTPASKVTSTPPKTSVAPTSQAAKVTTSGK